MPEQFNIVKCGGKLDVRFKKKKRAKVDPASRLYLVKSVNQLIMFLKISLSFLNLHLIMATR